MIWVSSEIALHLALECKFQFDNNPVFMPRTLRLWQTISLKLLPHYSKAKLVESLRNNYKVKYIGNCVSIW